MSWSFVELGVLYFLVCARARCLDAWPAGSVRAQIRAQIGMAQADSDNELRPNRELLHISNKRNTSLSFKNQ